MSKEKFLRLLFPVGAVLVILAISLLIFAVQKNEKVRSMLEQGGMATQESIFSEEKSNPEEKFDQGDPEFFEPISEAESRVTKKPFGIFVSPKNSPVSPERFQGFHTAVDLETFPDEQKVDIAVNTLCAGKILLKKTASGYGGVVVQSCMLDGKGVSVVYGHLDLESVNVNIGDQIKGGDFLGFLGKGYSSQTDGERKHLHLGIHKGEEINIAGYVRSKEELEDWIDPAKYLE